MNKIIDHYGSLLSSLLVIMALIIALFSETLSSLLLKWLSLCLLWGTALFYLTKTTSFYSIIKDKAFLGYSIFIGWAIISCLMLSSAKSVSIIMLIPFVGGLLSYFIAYNGTDKKELTFDWLILGLGLILVIYTYYQKFILGDSRPTGLLNNWNTHAALLSLIILPWILRSALSPSIKLFQLFYLSFFIFLFAFAMGLTLSRGAIIILVISIVCFIALAWCRRLFFKRSMVFITALILGYLLTSFFVPDNVMSRLHSLSEADSLQSIGSGRHLIWLPAWQMFLDKPFIGWGLGTFHLLYEQYKSPLSDESGYFAHNDYLQFLVELGPIGLIIFIGFIAVLLNRLFQLIIVGRPKSSYSKHKIEAFSFLIPCIGLLTHSFFTFNLYQLTMQILWGYYLGRSARHYQMEQKPSLLLIKKEFNQKLIWLHRGVVSVVIVLISCFGLSFYFLQQAEQSKKPQTKLDYYWKASLFFPALEYYDSLSASLLSKKINQIQTNNDPLQQRQQIAALALNEVDSAISKVPFNPRNYLTKASILKSMQQDISKINNQYDKSLLIAPAQLSVRYSYAHYLIEQQNYKQALAILWGAWDRINKDYYKKGIQYLTYQLEVSKQYGNSKDNQVIEREIQHLTKLKETNLGGSYVFNTKNDEQ